MPYFPDEPGLYLGSPGEALLLRAGERLFTLVQEGAQTRLAFLRDD